MDALYGVNLFCPPIGKTRNIQELLAALKKKMETLKPEQWVTGGGYDNSLLQDNRHPTGEDLDQVSATAPILSIIYRGTWEWLTALP